MERVENVKEIEEKVVVEEPVEMVEESTEGKKEKAIRLAKKGIKIAGIVVGGLVAFGVIAAIVKGNKTTDLNPIENVDYTVEK